MMEKDMVLFAELQDKDRVNGIFAELTEGTSQALGKMDLLRMNIAVHVLEAYLRTLKESPLYCPEMHPWIESHTRDRAHIVSVIKPEDLK